MHDGILKILIATMLFVSLEGVAESVGETSFHQSHHIHADDADALWFPNTESDDHEGDSYEHFCHAHVVGLTSHISLPVMPKFRHNPPAFYTHARTRGDSPPTPPPNI